VKNRQQVVHKLTGLQNSFSHPFFGFHFSRFSTQSFSPKAPPVFPRFHPPFRSFPLFSPPLLRLLFYIYLILSRFVSPAFAPVFSVSFFRRAFPPPVSGRKIAPLPVGGSPVELQSAAVRACNFQTVLPRPTAAKIVSPRAQGLQITKLPAFRLLFSKNCLLR
jgi:hypothetical protein